MKIWKNSARIIAVSAVCIAATTPAQAREDRVDPTLTGIVITQEIIDQIYRSGTKRLTQPPLLADICPLLAAHS